MNTASKLLSVAASALVLSACASTDTAHRITPQSSFQTDTEYVAAVEEATRKAGVRVVWVNPPQERIDEE